ncbi:MAG TPA: nucleotidyltransferase family protein [Methylovirgula sp.]|nr:nucleotidyltransferase family protein [Methylovirgula sp.]
MSRIAAVILAAGRSTRFGEEPKVTAELDGKPLVRHVAEAALASQARPVLVVVGHAAERTCAALAGLDVEIVHSADFTKGLAHSLRAGFAGLSQDVDGAIVLLADMPRISPRVIDRLIEAFANAGAPRAAVPVYGGRRGNPVLLGSRLFGALGALEGDCGAREILGADVVECAIEDEAVTSDIDTQDDLLRLAGRAQASAIKR